MRNLLAFILKAVLDPEEALEAARSEKRHGVSNAPKVAAVLLIAVVLAVVLTVIAVKFPDIDSLMEG